MNYFLVLFPLNKSNLKAVSYLGVRVDCLSPQSCAGVILPCVNTAFYVRQVIIISPLSLVF